MGADGSLRSLAEVRAERPLSAPEALSVMRDVAGALAAGQAMGLVHGAVCAENIVLDAAGAARLCRDTLRPRQLSPEERRGKPPDVRSDIYGLGAAIAQALEGGPPTPEPVRRLLATMTAEEPGLRPQTPDEVLLGIEACELLTGLRATPPGRPARVPEARGRLLPLMVIGLSLLVLGLALAALSGRTPPSRGKPPESFKPLLDKMVPVNPRP